MEEEKKVMKKDQEAAKKAMDKSAVDKKNAQDQKKRASRFGSLVKKASQHLEEARAQIKAKSNTPAAPKAGSKAKPKAATSTSGAPNAAQDAKKTEKKLEKKMEKLQGKKEAIRAEEKPDSVKKATAILEQEAEVKLRQQSAKQDDNTSLAARLARARDQHQAAMQDMKEAEAH